VDETHGKVKGKTPESHGKEKMSPKGPFSNTSCAQGTRTLYHVPVLVLPRLTHEIPYAPPGGRDPRLCRGIRCCSTGGGFDWLDITTEHIKNFSFFML